MNKNMFIQELRKKLKRLPQEEIDNAISYYIEYFDEAGIENEQEVLKELDSPANIASQLLADYAFKSDVVSTGKSKKSISSIWFIILSIMAAPIALPLAVALIAVVFAMVLVVAALAFSISLIIISLIGSGLVVSFAGMAVMTQGFATSIMFIGLGMTCIGVGLLGGIVVLRVTPKVFKSIIGFVIKSLSRLKKSNRKAVL